MKKIFVALFMIAVLLGGTGIATAKSARITKPSTPAVIADTMIIRPMALGATVLGFGIFIFALPAALATNSVGTIGDRLIREPARYALRRPVGEI